jgi:hypothetical protein
MHALPILFPQMSFGGTGSDAVLDVAAASIDNMALVYAGGRFAGGSATLPLATGVTTALTLQSADQANAATPAGFIAVVDAAKGGAKAALTVGGGGISGATFTYAGGDSPSLVNTPFATMPSKAIDGVKQMPLEGNSFVRSLARAKAPEFTTDAVMPSGDFGKVSHLPRIVHHCTSQHPMPLNIHHIHFLA